MQVLEQTLRDHLISHYPVLRHHPLKHLPYRGHYLLDYLALHLIVRLPQRPRGHRVDLTVQLGQPPVLQERVLYIFLRKRGRYSDGFLSGEDADALVDPHLVLELRRVPPLAVHQPILHYLDQHLLVQLTRKGVH